MLGRQRACPRCGVAGHHLLPLVPFVSPNTLLRHSLLSAHACPCRSAITENIAKIPVARMLVSLPSSQASARSEKRRGSPTLPPHPAHCLASSAALRRPFHYLAYCFSSALLSPSPPLPPPPSLGHRKRLAPPDLVSRAASSHPAHGRSLSSEFPLTYSLLLTHRSIYGRLWLPIHSKPFHLFHNHCRIYIPYFPPH